MTSHMIEKIDQSWKTEIQLKKDKFWKLRSKTMVFGGSSTSLARQFLVAGSS